MKEKIVKLMRKAFGATIMVVLFAGGATFFGYLAALCVGGEAAAAICHFIYKQFMPVIIKVTTGTVLFGLLIMYVDGEVALTATGKKKEKN